MTRTVHIKCRQFDSKSSRGYFANDVLSWQETWTTKNHRAHKYKLKAQGYWAKPWATGNIHSNKYSDGWSFQAHQNSTSTTLESRNLINLSQVKYSFSNFSMAKWQQPEILEAKCSNVRVYDKIKVLILEYFWVYY